MCGIQLRITKERVEELLAYQQQTQLPAQHVPSQPAPALQPQAQQETNYPPQPSYYEQNLPPQQ